MLCLPDSVIIDCILSHLYPRDLALCKQVDAKLRRLIEDNAEYIDSICQHIQPHGKSKTWHNNGQLFIKDNYKEGLQHGEYKQW